MYSASRPSRAPDAQATGAASDVTVWREAPEDTARRARTARIRATVAMAAGRWADAATWEERAALLEHEAALARDEHGR